MLSLRERIDEGEVDRCDGINPLDRLDRVIDLLTRP